MYLEELKPVEYSDEAAKLSTKKGGDWFNARAGTFEIEFLDEATEKEAKGYQGVMTTKLFLKIKVTGTDEIEGREYKGDEMMYSCNKGNSPSIYSQAGQIILIGKEYGLLKGKKVTLEIDLDGRKRNFKFKEARPLINEILRKQKEDAVSVSGIKG